ncbi:MAG: GAF domain-containing sensor histidine kinase [Chitinophagaceae bacterium]
MTNSAATIQADIDAIARIPIIPSLLEVVCRTTGMGFAAIARVTSEKWIACGVRDEIAFGLAPGGELKLETTICNEIRKSGEGVVIDNVAEDKQFCRHPTPAMYGFQSYISMPIFRRNGEFFGTLCALDPKPARVNNTGTLGMFKLFSDLISFHLEAAEELIASASKLREANETADLREQFIAILGHDLRNPISAISASAQLMQIITKEEEVLRLANVINNSVYRTQGLIENILDFARGRLGEGIILNAILHTDMEAVLQQVIAELRAVFTNRVIDAAFDLEVPVYCDGSRIAQLFSNLLSNSLNYGTPDTPVKVYASSTDDGFVLSVTNNGNQIPDAAMKQLFKAFYRADIKPGQQGLGLGLYIASEIARAHAGVLSVASTTRETSFTLHMPTTQPGSKA